MIGFGFGFRRGPSIARSRAPGSRWAERRQVNEVEMSERVGGTTGVHASAATSSPAEIRARLRTAAIELLEEHGYEGLRLGAVARRAGLTLAALNERYAGKDDLVADAIAHRQASLFGRALVRRPGDEALAADLLRALTQRSPDEYRAVLDVIAAASRDERIGDVLRPLLASHQAAIEEVVEAARLDAQIDPTLDVSAVGYVTNLLSLGSVVGHAIGLPSPSNEALAVVLDRLAEAIAPVSPSGSAPDPSDEDSSG